MLESDAFEMFVGGASFGGGLASLPTAGPIALPLSLFGIVEGGNMFLNGLQHFKNDLNCYPHDFGIAPSPSEVIANGISQLTGMPEIGDAFEDVSKVYGLFGDPLEKTLTSADLLRQIYIGDNYLQPPYPPQTKDSSLHIVVHVKRQ